MRHPPGSFIPWLLLGMVALIAYGSLYPFTFKPEAFDGGPFEALRQLSWARAGRSDRIANVLLYLPLGFCLLLWLGARLGRKSAALVAVALGSLLSLSIEIAQVYVSPRVSSLTDFMLNTGGTALGVAGGFAWHAMSRLVHCPVRGEAPRRDGGAALVVALWLAWRFAPFQPQADLGKLKAALRPLFDPQLQLGAVLAYLAFWLVVSEALAALVARARHLEALLLTIAVSLVGRLLVAHQAFVPDELAALLLLLPTLIVMNRLTPAPKRLLLVGALTTVLVLERLWPFELTATPGEFDFWPFMAWLAPGLPAALVATDWSDVFGSLFMFAAVLWTLRETGWSVRTAGVATVGLVAATEVMQAWLVERSASVTDPALAALVAGAFLYLEARRRRNRLGSARITAPRGRSL